MANPKPKIVMDCIHGRIPLNPLIIKIIDTREFQRQRNLRQLNTLEFVYPTANHTRFQHAIGTYHLASKMIQHLKNSLPEGHNELITDKDVLCVEIAALCHDIGHGPFSHFWDGLFVKRMKQERSHEDWGADIIKVIYNKLFADFDKYGLKEYNLELIQSIITGKTFNKITPEDTKKKFLYEIVANKESGNDVDKWDYLSRDAYFLGQGNHCTSSLFDRLIKAAKIATSKEGEYHIAFDPKEIYELNLIFIQRHLFHRIAYNHIVGRSVDLMVFDAFAKADKCLELTKRCSIKLKESLEERVAKYLTLDDSIFWNIVNWPESDKDMKKSDKDMKESDKDMKESDKDMKDAKAILLRVLERDLYTCVGETMITNQSTNQHNQFNLNDDTIKREIFKLVEKDKLTEDDIDISSKKIDFGCGEENPIKKILFFRNVKENPLPEVKSSEDIDISDMLKPKSAIEVCIFVYLTVSRTHEEYQKKKTILYEAFEKWCDKIRCDKKWRDKIKMRGRKRKMADD